MKRVIKRVSTTSDRSFGMETIGSLTSMFCLRNTKREVRFGKMVLVHLTYNIAHDL